MRLPGPSGISTTIANLIRERVTSAAMVTQYRTPLVGYARASDPRFDELQELVMGHLHPRDLLADARSVCVFFVPFARQTVETNARGDLASEEWARAYVETNALLFDICGMLAVELGQLGVLAAWQPPTHSFDPIRLVSSWSHKSAAVIAGLGRLGHHHMLITDAGCAGRLGSIVLDADMPASPLRKEVFCAFDRGCRACVDLCPVGALTQAGLDRHRCYARCLENDARFPRWTADVCGICATGPCAVGPAVRTNASNR